MAVLDNDMAVYVAQVPSPHSMRMFTEVGRRVHMRLHRSWQSASHAASRRRGVRTAEARGHAGFSNENTHTTPDALMADIELSRSRGYAVDEGEQEIGVRCFAVPVPDAPPTAISISGPASRLTLKSATKVAPLLKRVARDLASEFDKEAAG